MYGMKLYYSPFACSLATHIALREAGIDFALERIELWTNAIPELNPMSQVPTLVTDDGKVLTESIAVLSWLGRSSSVEPYEQLKWLSLVATEVHKKGLNLVFDPDSSEEVKAFGRKKIQRPLGVLEKRLTANDYLLGATPSVADAYLFWALTIAPFGGVPLDAYPALRAYHARLLERPAYRTAVKLERDARAATA